MFGVRQNPGWCAFVLLFSTTIVRAEEVPDKTEYDLLHPVPAALLRELSTDRPDKTESPYTVDAGHLQIELDLVSYSYDRDNSEHADHTVENFAVAPANFRWGLTNKVEIQLIAETFVIENTNDRDARTNKTISGFGDMLVRCKINFWGNDGGQSAVAMMPFIKFPTNRTGLGNNVVEGGVIFPLALALPRDWSLGAMTEIDWLQDATNSGYHPEFVNTITLGHEIVKNVSGYVEFFSSVSTEKDAEWIGTFDVGLTYQVSANMQLDAGVNIGLTRSADDLNPFLGLTIRY